MFYGKTTQIIGDSGNIFFPITVKTCNTYCPSYILFLKISTYQVTLEIDRDFRLDRIVFYDLMRLICRFRKVVI